MTSPQDIEIRCASQPPPRRRTDVTVHVLDGEALIYDPLTACTHQLNSTALFIWRQCDGRRDVCEIARGLAEVYDVSVTEAVEHSRRTVEEFEEKLLLTTADDAISLERANVG